jgi:preprotein translocase SecE subunit
LAETAGDQRRPRIRKSAPTLRERQEQARVKEEQAKPGVIRRTATKLASPFRRLRLGNRSVVKVVLKPFKLLGRVLSWLVPKYLVNSWRELRLVHWPNRRETWRLTLAVFIFAIVFGALVAGVDKTLDIIFKKVVLK